MNYGLQIIDGPANVSIMGCKYQWYELWVPNINGSANFYVLWAPKTFMNYGLQILMSPQAFRILGLIYIYALANLRIMAPKYCLQAYELWGPNINGPVNL